MIYSEMSDFEISKAVADKMGYAGRTSKHPMIDDVVLISNSLGGFTRDYCNSWADAGPIIQELGIELSYDGISWSAGNNLHDIGWYNDWKNHPESPCRLAMIVFLMMKEADNG